MENISNTNKLKEKFIQDLYKLHGDKFRLIGTFTNRETKTDFLCECGNTFNTRPKDVMRKNKLGCSKCYASKKETYHNGVSEKEMIQRVKEKYPNGEFEYISGYTKMKEKAFFKHASCGEEFELSPQKLLAKANSNECPKCPSNKKTHEQFIQEVYDLWGDEYTVKSKYENNKKEVEFAHECGHEFKMKPNYFLYRDIPCEVCRGVSLEEYTERFNSIFLNKEFTIVNYEAMKKPVLLEHKCGHQFSYSQAIDPTYTGAKCPVCHKTRSLGEITIERFLIDNKIDFKTEYKFDTCKDKQLLRFDFYIPKYKLLLEYDGQQHFKSSWGKSKVLLEQTQRRDSIKNEWVKNSNKYRLIRIRYDQDLEYILKRIFIDKKISKKDLFVIWN